VVSVARKLAVLLHHIWTTQEAYLGAGCWQESLRYCLRMAGTPLHWPPGSRPRAYFASHALSPFGEVCGLLTLSSPLYGESPTAA
jgi:hypothetical protein